MAMPDRIAVVVATGARVDLPLISQHQQSCPSVQQARGSSSLQVQPVDVDGVRVLCDVSTGSARPIIPLADRRATFLAFHGLAHAGTRATRRLMAARVVWRGMNSDVAAWIKDCQACCKGKVTSQPAAPVQPIPVPARRFTHIHIDIVGPLPVAADGSAYLLTMVDRTTRWLEACPMANMEAATCADSFISTWVSRYGVPATITTDQGRQFTSALWAVLCSRLGMEHITTTAYHPQANGMVERAHRQLKDALRARLAGPQWPSHLPWALLGLRAAPKEDSAMSSAELLFGAPLTLPGQLLESPEEPLEQVVERLRSTQPPPTRPITYAEVSAASQRILSAQYVYVRRCGVIPPLSPLYTGPFAVVARGPKVFKIQVGDRQESISVDRLKPHLGSSPVVPAAPPARGRPPSSSGPAPASSASPASAGGGSCRGLK